MSQFTILRQEDSPEPVVPPIVAKAVKPRKQRLTTAGVGILQEYLRTHPNEIPPLIDRQTLLQRVLALPGNDHIKGSHILDWFKRRKYANNNQTSTTTYVDSNCHPSLTGDSIAYLEKLLKATPNPSPELISIWADLLGPINTKQISSTDILEWLHYRTVSSNQLTHPPTPSDTVSPEPSGPPTPVSPTQSYRNRSVDRQCTPSSYVGIPYNSNTSSSASAMKVKDPMESPVLPPISVELKADHKMQLNMMYQSSPSLSSLNVDPLSRNGTPGHSLTPHTARSRQNTPLQQSIPMNYSPSTPSGQGAGGVSNLKLAILQGVADVMAHPISSSSKVPGSAAEFNTMFSSHDKKLTQLLQFLESSDS